MRGYGKKYGDCIFNPALWPRSWSSNARTSIHHLEPYLYHLQRPYMVLDRLEQSKTSFSCTILIRNAYISSNYSGLVASNNFYLIRTGHQDLVHLNNFFCQNQTQNPWRQWIWNILPSFDVYSSWDGVVNVSPPFFAYPSTLFDRKSRGGSFFC